MVKVFRTGDVARMVGVSRNTIYNWLGQGKIREVAKDRNRRRIFTETDIKQIRAFKDRVIPPSHSK